MPVWGLSRRPVPIAFSRKRDCRPSGLGKPEKNTARGFVQPTRPHEPWHTDIACLNIRGTHDFFLSVLDGHSRSIVHHEVRLAMETRDVEDYSIQRLHASTGYLTPEDYLKGASHVAMLLEAREKVL